MSASTYPSPPETKYAHVFFRVRPSATQILLVATILLFLFYVIFVLWPHLAKLKADAARQSALLSHVPAEVDTVGHVKAVVRAARSCMARRAAAATGSKVSTVATAAGV